MSETQSISTPTDATPTPKGKRAKKQRRYRLFPGDDGGDFRIYVISEDPAHAKGTLIPAPGVGGFDSTHAAQKFLRAEGHRFVGLQLMISKAVHMARIALEEKPQVKVEWKPRAQVSGPPKE
jgi:hypothetical protein